jgi:uncharacterized protein (DUF1330 family)
MRIPFFAKRSNRKEDTMSAFFVARVSVKDGAKFQEYAQKAGATFGAHGGELVLRGAVTGALAGTRDHQSVGIVKFPSAEALSAWYASPEYQALIPLRDEAADMAITTYEMPA